MTFTKENAADYGRKGGKARVENLDKLLSFIAGGGSTEVQRIIGDLLKGNEVTDEEKEGVNYFLKLLPYKKPVLARQEHTGSVDHNHAVTEVYAKLSK